MASVSSRLAARLPASSARLAAPRRYPVPSLFEARQLDRRGPVAADGEGPAIEYQFVLSADLIHVDDRHAVLLDTTGA